MLQNICMINLFISLQWGSVKPKVYFSRPFDVIFIIRRVRGSPHTPSTCIPIVRPRTYNSACARKTEESQQLYCACVELGVHPQSSILWKLRTQLRARRVRMWKFKYTQALRITTNTRWSPYLPNKQDIKASLSDVKTLFLCSGQPKAHSKNRQGKSQQAAQHKQNSPHWKPVNIHKTS